MNYQLIYKRCACVLLVLITCCVAVRSDQVTLKNGDRLTGKILHSDGATVVIKTDLVGQVTVPLAAVVRLSGEAPLYVTLVDGRTMSGALTTEGGKAELRNANNATVVDRAQIAFVRSADEQQAYERTLNPGWLEQWSGGLDFGVALTSGNSDTLNLALGLGLTRETRRDKTTLYAASIYNRDSTSGVSHTIANTIRGGLRYDRDFSRKWFAYGFTDLEHNALQDLTLRMVLGGGIGYHAVRNDRTKLDFLGGLAWNRESFSGNFNDRSSAEAQLGQTLSHHLSKRTSLKEQFFVFPNLSRGGEYRINFDSTVVTDITRRIGWQL